MGLTARQAREWLVKWRWYERDSLPWRRALIHYEMASRGAFVRWPIQGEILEMFREGRLEVGEGTLFEPGVWLTGGERGRIRIGSGTFLNQTVMVAASELVEIGDHCMLANGALVTDADHSFEDLSRPITHQGFTAKGPTRIGSTVWLGAACVVTGGVTIGERTVVGAGSVVTGDLPDGVIAAGAPARILREIDFGS
ncbi:MAG: acyltransferase [Solirubrobacterales bacterium]